MQIHIQNISTHTKTKLSRQACTHTHTHTHTHARARTHTRMCREDLAVALDYTMVLGVDEQSLIVVLLEKLLIGTNADQWRTKKIVQ
jgi:hypothetical protein